MADQTPIVVTTTVEVLEEEDEMVNAEKEHLNQETLLQEAKAILEVIERQDEKIQLPKDQDVALINLLVNRLKQQNLEDLAEVTNSALLIYL